MKQFLKVFRFELAGFLKSKWFRISTILVCVIVSVVMFLPRFINIFGAEKVGGTNVSDTTETLGLYDPTNIFQDGKALKAGFPKATFKSFKSSEELKQQLKNGMIYAGFEVTNATSYHYYVMDTQMADSKDAVFSSLMSMQYQTKMLANMGVDASKINEIVQTSMQGDMVVLGRDGVKNYLYTYIMVFLLYFVILFYGQMTATGVASEKGNRSMEILVTSVSCNSLLFGKVIGGAVAGVLQVSLMLGVSAVMYQINVEQWNHMLDFLFQIPIEVLATFAIFGTLGYLFYSFIYGALGAMVSKVEDISSAIAPITMIFIASFFLTFYNMMQPDTILGTIASYLPFSSCMAMFTRMAMESVSLWEVLLSAGILLLSTIGMGYFGARMYRRGTLMYGNTMKFKHIFKFIRKKED